jgi:Domain of unknown function (DUF4157)
VPSNPFNRAASKPGVRRDFSHVRAHRETDVPAIVGQALESPGQPLDRSIRDVMEQGFGTTFGHVSVHSDSLAARSARAVHAEAYTVGNHLVFAENSYTPGTTQGRLLIAHELAHVVQQGNAPFRGSPLSLRIETAGETTAEQAARNVVGGSPAGDLCTGHMHSIQRQFFEFELTPELTPEMGFEPELEFEFEPEVEEAPEFEEVPEQQAAEPAADEAAEQSAEPEQAPQPGPKLGPKPVPLPGPVPTAEEEEEEEPDKCQAPDALPAPGPMPPKPLGVRVRLVLPSQKSAAGQLAAYQRYREVLEHDVTYVRGRPAQARKWDGNVRPGGTHGMSPVKYHEGRTLGIPRERIFRPDWTKLNANVPTMQVDHMIELQVLPRSLQSGWGDTFDNYELLDQRSNTSAGPTLSANIARERRRLFALTCDPRWLTCFLRFDEIVPTPGQWTGARWSSDEIIRGDQVDAWRRLHGTTPGAAIPPPAATTKSPAATTKSPAATTKLPADFTSTMDICYRLLKSRVFPVKDGGLRVTISADWRIKAGATAPGAQCGPSNYYVSLEQKGWIYDSEISTSKPIPTGKRFNIKWRELPRGDYYLLILAGEAHGPYCCLQGDISVFTFSAPPTPRSRRPRTTAVPRS